MIPGKVPCLRLQTGHFEYTGRRLCSVFARKYVPFRYTERKLDRFDKI